MPLVRRAQLALCGKEACLCLKLSQPCECLLNVRTAVGVDALAVLVLADLEHAIIGLDCAFNSAIEEGVGLDASVFCLN